MKLSKKILLLILILTVSLLFNHFVVTDLYNESSIFGSFTYKFERAQSIEEPKTILIGGSAGNLSFDSQLFEELSGKPAVNLALTAGVPLRVYMKAAELCSNPGDTVILSMEYSYYSKDFLAVHETYADMVAVDSDLKCDDGFWGNIEYAYTAFLRSYTRLNDYLLFFLKQNMEAENTIYIKDSVNAYGDFCLHEGKNPTHKSQVGVYGFEWSSDVMENIRQFMDRMESRGVRVLFTYPPVDKNYFYDYQSYSSSVQSVTNQYFTPERCLGTPLDFFYNESFFFDTVYHVKYENRAIYTQDLYEQYEKAGL